MKDTLKQAIITQLGYESEDDQELIETCRDINRFRFSDHGIDGGFSGFIYYSDTCRFFDENRQDILEHAFELADDLGETMAGMIAGFRCLDVTANEVERFLVLGGDDDDAMLIKNALAWFAAEELAREISDSHE